MFLELFYDWDWKIYKGELVAIYYNRESYITKRNLVNWDTIEYKLIRHFYWWAVNAWQTF